MSEERVQYDAGEKPTPTNKRKDHFIATKPVESSRFKEIGHDPERNTLAIRFPPRKSAPDEPGALYHYSNFTADDYAHFTAAESLGVWFGHNILTQAAKWPPLKMEE